MTSGEGRTALVLAGGPLRPTVRLRARAAEADLVIAADGGLRHAHLLGLVPDLVIGDFDSVRDEELARWPGLPQERHPTDKDALDLELAIDAALARGASTVRVLGAFGGRFDQTLATALIAIRYARGGLDIAMLDGIHDAYPLVSGGRLDAALPHGTAFSLLSIGDPARVDVTGASYELADAELPMGVGRGLSNRSAGGPDVRIRSGLVLVIVEWEA